MKDMGQTRWVQRGAYSLMLLVTVLLTGMARGAAAPNLASVIESKPVVTGPLYLSRLQGEVVCIYNFSSW